MLHATRHSAYHGVNDGFLVVLPDVVIEEDVLDGRVEGVHPEGLPPHQGARVLGPPGGRRRRGLIGWQRQPFRYEKTPP